MKTIVNNSVTADNNSSINNVRVKSNKTNSKVNISTERKKGFWIGFASGILSSIIGSAIWHYIQKFI